MIKRVCVCGAGTMGSGIALVAARAGLPVTLYELNEQVLEKARAGIGQNLAILVEKKKITETEKEAIYQRISFTSQIEACGADICIEAIIEKADAKISLFNRLSELNGPDCILASNTSSLSVTAIAAGVVNPGRVIGLHFFNPAPVMKLVEVVNTRHTLPEVTAAVVALAKQMDKTPVICKDAPGFIVNRVARPYYIEAFRLVEEGHTDFAQLDELMEASGFKLGPFKLMDLIGNDINYAVSCSVYEQLGKPERLKPSYIQQDKVTKGELGKKTGKGYYSY